MENGNGNGNYGKKNDVVYTRGVIKVTKMEYPSLSLVSTKIHCFEFPSKDDGTLDEKAARKKYVNYYSQSWLEKALQDARDLTINGGVMKRPSNLETEVEEPTERKSKKNLGDIL